MSSLRVFHEYEIVDHARCAVVPVEIGQDGAHGFERGHVIRVPSMLVAGPDRVEQEPLKGLVPYRCGFLLGYEEFYEVLLREMSSDLVRPEEQTFEDRPGVLDIVRLLHLDDLRVLEKKFVERVEKRVRDI